MNVASTDVKTDYIDAIVDCINAGNCDNNADNCKDCNDKDFDGGGVEESPHKERISDDGSNDKVEEASPDTAPRIKISRKTPQGKRSRMKKCRSNVKKSRAAPEPGKEAAVENLRRKMSIPTTPLGTMSHVNFDSYRTRGLSNLLNCKFKTFSSTLNLDLSRFLHKLLHQKRSVIH